MPDIKFSNLYPYTDFHELNLDWVIKEVKYWSTKVGKTIQSIEMTGSSGLVDTYRITYSDGTTFDYEITNGRGIVSIVMTSVAGLVDTYTVTYNDGTTSMIDVTNGRGIVSIEKTTTVGLTDTYTITYNDGTESTFEVENGAAAIDATLTQAGYAADAKAVGDALDLKQDKDEPIALAENLTPYSPDSGVSQDQPFILQGTGTGNGESVIDTGSYAQIKKKLGNSVTVNQLIRNGNFAATTGWSTQYGTLAASGNKGTYTRTAVNASARLQQTVDIPAGRKLWITVTVTPSAAARFRLTTNRGETLIDSYDVSAGEKVTKTVIVTLQNAANALYFYNDRAAAGAIGDTVIYENAYVTDLSLWHGSTGRIPAHLLSHPKDFGRYYSGSLAANPGQLVNADGSVLTSIGRNCWNGVNDVIAIPNQTYYCKGTATITYKDRGGNTMSTASVTNTSFTTPTDCFSFGVSGTGVTISLYYPDESGYDSDYPFSVLAQIDTGSEVLRSTGSVADEKTPDGTITRKVGIVDLGTLTWTYESGVFYSTGMSATAKPQQYPKCSRYVANDDGSDMSIYIGNSGILYVYDGRYTNAAAFQTAMNGVEMTYELITYSTETGSAFTPTFDINDFGSMSWNVTTGIPQGIEIFYPVDYKAAIDTLLNLVDDDVSKIVTTDTYPDVPTADGTYVLKATVSGGTATRSWALE